VAVRWQWLLNSPFADVRRLKPVPKKWHRLTVEEYHSLLDAAPNLRWKCFYALAFTSGARFGELFNLTWTDIDFDSGRMNIQNREGTDKMPPFLIKDHEARFVQLPKHTIDLLVKYQNEAPENVPYILLKEERYNLVLKKWYRYRKTGKEWKNRYMVNNVNRDFRVHAKWAEIQFNAKFTTHTFRKTCAQNWADRLPANVVKFYLGHSNLNTTNKFYSIVDQSHLNLTKDVMDEMLEKGKTQNHLDTEQTLEPEKDEKTDTKKDADETASSVNPPLKDTSKITRPMEPTGIEPTTSCMPCKRSPN
jgi:integrase